MKTAYLDHSSQKDVRLIFNRNMVTRYRLRPVAVALLVCLWLAAVGLPPGFPVERDSWAGENRGVQDWLNKLPGKGLDEPGAAAAKAVGQEFSRQISSVEWLAPLAPIALSPFFGITLLSGLACYGPAWLPDNALLSSSSPLANPTLFWVFLMLTALTSAPRFSKVSKPFAQLADFLETYSALIILLVFKVISSQNVAPASAMHAELTVHAGLISSGWDGLLMIAMVINMIVINSVKFFFEILIWITPIPFLDACFELANKGLCAALTAIYAFSPIIALVINAVLFVLCAIAFTWIRRREVFYRTLLFDWVLGLFQKPALASTIQLTVFPKNGVGRIPARARCRLNRIDSGWQLIQYRLWGGSAVETLHGRGVLAPGWWSNSVTIGDNDCRLSFSVRHNPRLREVADLFGFELADSMEKLDKGDSRQVEFA